MGAIAPYDLRQLLNKICGAKDADWTTYSGTNEAKFESELLYCYYQKKNSVGEILVSKKTVTPTQVNTPKSPQELPTNTVSTGSSASAENVSPQQKSIVSEQSTSTSAPTSNKTPIETVAMPNTCIADKQALFQQRRSKQIERYKKEAQQRGEAFNVPSADSVALVMTEVAKAAASSCIAESEAQLNGKPSFDCAKAINDDEKLICGSRNLAAMDVKLSNAYKAALFFSVDKEVFKAQSRNWIETRRQCKDAPCVERLYTEQQAHLRMQLE
jgi:uncharacterized protein YecT (DUF1311 family)